MSIFKNKEADALREELAEVRRQRDSARESLVFLSQRLGQFEHQRNHALWKAARRKKWLREFKEKVRAELLRGVVPYELFGVSFADNKTPSPVTKFQRVIAK